MKNETRSNFLNHAPLTVKALNSLQTKGFKYVQVKGFTLDRHADYVEPYYIMLVPIKELPTDPAKKDIYEPINSSLLVDWANDTNSTLEVLLANSKN